MMIDLEKVNSSGNGIGLEKEAGARMLETQV